MLLLTALAPSIMVADLRGKEKTSISMLDQKLREHGGWIVANQPFNAALPNSTPAALLILVRNGEHKMATYVWPEGTMFDQVFEANIRPEHSLEKIQNFITDLSAKMMSKTLYVEMALRLHQLSGEILSFSEPITKLNTLRNLDQQQRAMINHLYGITNPNLTEQESDEAILSALNRTRMHYLNCRKAKEQEKHRELHEIGKKMEELNNRSNALRTELGLGGKMNLHFSITEEEQPKQDLSTAAARHQYITQMKTCFDKLKEILPEQEAANYVRNQLGLRNDCSPKLQ